MKSTEEFILGKSDYFNYEPSVVAKETFFYPVCIGHFFYEAGYHQFRNSYDSFLFMEIVSGNFYFDLNGKLFQAGPKTLVLIDCYAPHGYYVKAAAECYWYHFDGILVKNYYQLITERFGNVIALPSSSRISHDFNKIYEVFSKSLPIREVYISNKFNNILSNILLMDAEEKISDSTSYIEQTLSYINSHYGEAVTVDELAKNVSLSKYYFIRLFKRETGFTPHEYLLNKRLSTAKYLLKSTSLCIKDICFDTGFSSESVFCTAFKQKNGITPAQYRADEIP